MGRRHGTPLSWVVVGVAISITTLVAHAEDLTISTYYPSPRGVYQELRTTNNTYLATQAGSVGIGTTVPAQLLTLDSRAANVDAVIMFKRGGADYVSGMEVGSMGVADEAFVGQALGDSIVKSDAGKLHLGIGNGTPTVTLSGGNVGIGTTNPRALLHLSANAANIVMSTITNTAGPYEYFDTAPGYYNFRVGTEANVWSVANDTTPGSADANKHTANPDITDDTYSPILSVSATPPQVTIASGYNVGIGTTNPGGKLTVVSDTPTPGAAVTLFGGSYSPLEVVMDDSGNNKAYMSMHRGNVVAYQLGISDYDMVISHASGANHDDLKTELFRIQSTGNVGIGTKGPGALLTVAGDSAFDSEIGVIQIASKNTPGKKLYLGYDSIHDVGYIQGVYSGQTWGNNLALNPRGGNVGIGTASPSTTLDVNGPIRSTYGYAPTPTSGTGVMMYYDVLSGGIGVINSVDYTLARHELQIWGNPLMLNGANVTGLSDVRVKTNITDLPPTKGLEAIRKLRPVAFDWKDKEHNSEDGRQMGLIAQEAQNVFPKLVIKDSSPITLTLADGSKEKLSDHLNFNYFGLIVPLVKAVQELDTRTKNMSAEHGMTTKDTVTGQPYCMQVVNGQVQAVPRECP